MRVLSPIDRPFRDEHVIGVDPPLRPGQEGSWRRRINAFTGRSLSPQALIAEQDWRAGAQRLRGQSVTAGVIRGLDIDLGAGAVGAAAGDVVLDLSEGIGLTQSGEDIIVSSARRLTLADLRVHGRVDILDAIDAGEPFVSPEAPPPGEGPIAGLRPLLPRRTGPRLGDVVITEQANALPRAGVLVLQPVTATILAGEQDDCPPDARDDPYDDLQLIDGTRLVLYLWPGEVTAIAGGPDYTMPTEGPAFRNELAYRVFETERVNGRVPHPWEGVGLPIGLVGFNPDWTLAFLDRGAVVRMGGQPRPRTVFGPATGSPILWQARVAQLAEHMASGDLNTDADIAARLRFLPPVGFLPGGIVDLLDRRQTALPSNIVLSATPMPDDQAALVIDDNASLDPVDLGQPDALELLLAVPGDVYEPRLLEIEGVSDAFAAAIRRFEADRNAWFARREYVRRRQDILIDGITGAPGTWPTEDSPSFEVMPLAARPEDQVPAPLTAERIRRFAAGSAFTAHSYTDAGTSLRVKEGDRLAFWVRVTDRRSFTGISLRAASTTGTGFNHVSWWGAPTRIPFIANDPPNQRRRGDVPSGSGWVRLDVSVDDDWGGGGLAGLALNGFEFGQRGGTLEWGPLSLIDGEGRETTLLSRWLPVGARSFAGFNSDDSDWPWTEVVTADLADEAAYGVVGNNGRAEIAEITALRTRWDQPYLSDDFSTLDEDGLQRFIQETERKLDRTQDRIDLAFVRARADIYRLRQIILGGDAASKLVTSPALADLAIRDESARARADSLRDYLDIAFRTDPQRNSENPLERLPKTTSPAGSVTVTARRTTDSTPANALFVQPFLFAAQPPPARFVAPGAVAGTGTTVPIEGIQTIAPTRLFQPQASIAALQVFREGTTFKAPDVTGQRARPGAVERTVSIAERVNIAPAVEIHDYALDGKQDVLSMISELIAGGASRMGIALADLPVAGYSYRLDTPPAGRTPNTIGDLIAHRADYTDTDEIASDSARHEADYFAGATKAIDNAIAMLRLMEARASAYSALLADARKVQDVLEGVVTTAEERLRAIGSELAEARHDVSTAQSLLAEERARVEAVNNRRAEIIATYGETLLFRRPRRTDRLQDIPTAPARPAFTPSPIAVCRREDHALPEDVEEYIDLFHELPAKTLLAVGQRIDRINRLDAIRRSIAAMRLRAARVRTFRQREVAGNARFLRAVNEVRAAQHAAAERRRLTRLALDYGAMQRLDLLAARQRFLDHATLGDLAEGNHGQPQLGRLVGAELEAISDIAACLHATFGEVPAIIRLTWAETLSAFDEAVPLSHLSTLPRWGEIDIDLRRELQQFVTWLFSRIDRTNDDAEEAINELVRICLLMAAHAPVEQLIPARLVEPAPAQPGSVLTLAATVTLVQIGMTAIIRNPTGQAIARAAVEDIADGTVRARVTERMDRSVTSFTTGYKVDLSHVRRLR